MQSGNSLRERLVDVGVELVLTEGSTSLGLREIARRAGVSHGAPRRYFPTHHALLSAIARRGFADLGAEFTAALAAETTPRAQLQAVARAYVGYALERRGMFELMFRHDLLDSTQQGSDPPRLRETTLPLFERVVALVAQCRAERHRAAEEPPTVTAAALWSNLHGLAQLWAWGSLPLVLEAEPPGAARHDAGPERPAPLDALDPLLTRVLDAHLGPVGP
ncbi:TetR/AcrR family transcriptional regulator [Streptomyces sp. NPDC057579]|uniref:TetR/AcrR family transcriptional regulator n=1 Tax=Streptomyces sp. NPDC057579 TaxID=3346172 RepID=UPI003692AFBF